MKPLRPFITIVCALVASLAKADQKPAPVGAEQAPAKDGKKREPVDVRALFEKGIASGSLPEGMLIRLGACLGGPDEKAAKNGAPNEMRESWEFTANEVRRIVPGEEDNASRAESRPFDSKDLCKLLLEGKAIEIRARKGEGPEVGFVGSGYEIGSRSIEVVWKGETVLTLIETNGPTLHLYRESDARAFGALYEKLATQARVLFQPKAAPANNQGSVWGDAVKGLQMGVSPQAGTKGVPVALFDGTTLRLDVHLRNAGKTPVRIIPNTFGCAAVGPGGAIPVTKLLLTPSKGGDPLSITYQGHNHVSEKRPLDADDVEYFTTVLAPGEAMSFPVTYTPGEGRETSWQRAGGSNLVPEGKYQVKAIILVDRKESEWKGELTSGSLEVEIRSSDKK
jgi:hypothetical protein